MENIRPSKVFDEYVGEEGEHEGENEEEHDGDAETERLSCISNVSSSLDEAIPGKKGACYMRHGALCLNTQNYPDSVNHVNGIYFIY